MKFLRKNPFLVFTAILLVYVFLVGQGVVRPVRLLDTDYSHWLILEAGSDLSANRILTITTGDSARTITLSGNPTLADWFDQNVKQAATPIFDSLFLNDSENSKQTQGITVNQGENDDELISLKSSDVAHGVTDLTETDTFGYVKKYEATSGGMGFYGFTEAVAGIFIGAVTTSADTAKNANALAPVMINISQKNGTSTAAISEDGNLLVIQDHFSTRFIFDEDGDMLYDGAAPANYDAYDDGLLANDLNMVLSGKGDQTLGYGERALRELGILSSDEGTFVSTRNINKLVLGALGQLWEKDRILEKRISELETRK
jgi:hypothetical protein